MPIERNPNAQAGRTPSDESNSSYPPDRDIRNYSKRPSPPSFSFVWILLVYYRIYTEDGAIPSKTSAAPGDPFIGRIKAKSVPPPHTVKTIKLRIAKVEDIKDPTSSNLFLTPYSQSPMGGADKVAILNCTCPGSTPQEPFALVAKMSDSERSALESGERGGLAEAINNTASLEIRYRASILLFSRHDNIFDYWWKCTISFTPTILKCHPKQPLMKRNRVLVGSGQILLRRPIVSPTSSDTFREWNKTLHLSMPIFLRIFRAMSHWKKATFRSSAQIAQVWVQMSQWPSFNDHRSTSGKREFPFRHLETPFDTFKCFWWLFLFLCPFEIFQN